MSTINLFKRGYIIVALFALIITLHEDQVSAGKKVDCTYHFWPSPDSPRASCISQDDPKKDHSCALDSCRTPVKGTPPHQTTTSCELKSHSPDDPSIVHQRPTIFSPRRIPAQDSKGHWVDCNYADDPANNEYLSTAAKHTLFPLAGFKQTENCASLQHLR
ncbi:hypothetical protein MJO28_005618 [Puccinia striiformis f. sp. tritici]|uniref:Secreted protein n=2 Tax=Puccinia striiformis TaxID=27350 RepID=A0A2S4UTM5_9BASI|nr:hypothetical protein MJO28_005618 [Puccinia striiformis f. sp. tritici]POW00561.1 hypothetical protein PSHT_12949 [Puccinia striiformis]